MQKLSTIIAHIALTIALLSAAGRAPAQAPEQAAARNTPTLEFVFEEVVTLAPDIKVGPTPWGSRNIVPITGGTVTGPRIHGKILPGGWDWQLTSADGCFKLHADYFIQTDNGSVINVANTGTTCGKDQKILTTPAFEAPKGPYEWLNGGVYIGTLDGATVEGKPAVRLRFYKAIPHP